jgi:uncharacterized RmlC-like cupin family protein
MNGIFRHNEYGFVRGGGRLMARRTSSRRKLEAFTQGIHYVRAAEESRRRATKRAIRAGELRWEENVHGKSAYIVDSVTGFASKNLAMFIREIPPGAATGTHHHNFEAVAYVLEGRGHDVHDGRAVRWRTGDGLYIPPMVSHQHVNDDPRAPAWLLFIANWPLLNHLGITTFVQTGQAPRSSRARAAAPARRGGRSGPAGIGASTRRGSRISRVRIGAPAGRGSLTSRVRIGAPAGRGSRTSRVRIGALAGRGGRSGRGRIAGSGRRGVR